MLWVKSASQLALKLVFDKNVPNEKLLHLAVNGTRQAASSLKECIHLHPNPTQYPQTCPPSPTNPHELQTQGLLAWTFSVRG
jgi:hypothetical protein